MSNRRRARKPLAHPQQIRTARDVQKMVEGDHTFTVQDFNGNDHRWGIRTIPVIEGGNLAMEISTMAGGLSAFVVEDGEDLPRGTAIKGVLGMVDSLLKKGGMEFLAKLIEASRPTRDGLTVSFPEDDNTTNIILFDQAFDRNYEEMFAVVAEVLKWNFSPFFNSVSVLLEKHLGIKMGIETPESESSSSESPSDS